MIYRNQGMRVLGLLFIAALGMMAFMSAGAQANWLVLHPITNSHDEPDVIIGVTSHQEGNLLVKKETNLEILCSVIEEDAAAPLLLLAANSVGHGHIIFKTCKTWQNGVNISANCTPVEPILAGGLVEIKLHINPANGVNENYLLIKPLFIGGVEQNFTQIKFKAPCALPATNNIKGDATLECGHLNPPGTFVHLDCKNHQVTQLLREVPTASALFPHSLTYATKEALIDGIAAAKVTAPALYAGASWGACI